MSAVCGGERARYVMRAEMTGTKPGGSPGDLVKAEAMSQLALALPAELPLDPCFVFHGLRVRPPALPATTGPPPNFAPSPCA